MLVRVRGAISIAPSGHAGLTLGSLFYEVNLSILSHSMASFLKRDLFFTYTGKNRDFVKYKKVKIFTSSPN